MNGKLYVVGIGPGHADHLTPAARNAIEQSETVAGYRTYLDLIPDLLTGKELLASGMRQEIERCRLALEAAASGKTVALVSGGDAGIYGMAGLALEMAAELPVDVEIVPGVSAVQAAAARLGAPLMHDFAVISLSDLLTSWAVIQARLEAAARADFVVALYNPRSRQRTWQLEEARDILLQYRAPQTPVGIVRHACRPGETVTVTTLETLPVETIDMFSLVIIGNASTVVDATGHMVTPRGYEIQGRERPEHEGLPPRSPRAPFAAQALFVGGTGSDVGKSLMVAGLARLLHRQGVSVAPFKAQNMALNSAVTPDGGEIGRAQALQAQACRLEPQVDMNPVLLKPNSETGSQVIVQGRPVGNMTVGEYHAFKDRAFKAVEESYGRLAARHEVILIEGAGSIAEVNLKQHDITNLRMASLAGAPVLLVADIDRGGVFASILGTLELLDAEERCRVKGVVINRFRGDKSLLEPGLRLIEERTGVPVLGVVPWLTLALPEEDSVALGRKRSAGRGAGLNIGVVNLPRISNYTDFDPFEREPGVTLSYLDRPEQVAEMDLVILPGSKSVMADLVHLRETGMAQAILAHHHRGGRIVGVCGGFQMLGETIADPDQVESDCREMSGLGLLPVETTLAPVKQTHQVAGVPLPAGDRLNLAGLDTLAGYEIHMGETHLKRGAKALFRITRRSGQAVDLADGAISPDARTWGTYLHGLFDNETLRSRLLEFWGCRRAASVPGGEDLVDRELDRLADHLEAHLEMGKLWALLGCTGKAGA